MGYYVFEGMNGCGKSTLSGLFADTLTQQGQQVLVTREPGGTPLGQQLRTILLTGNDEMNTESQLFMMMADRSEHMEKVVGPALESGITVVSDRGFMSAMVFQGGSSVYSMEDIMEMNKLIMRGYEPEWFTVTADLSSISERLASREEQDNFEKAQDAQQSVYSKRYLDATSMLDGHFIDNNGTLDQSLAQVIQCLI